MASISEQRRASDTRDLIFKPNKAIGFVGFGETKIPESLYDENGELLDFKEEGFLPTGLVSSEGYTFSREVEREEITALGYTSPVLNPITTVPRTISFTPFEAVRKHLLEIEYGTDLSGTTIDPQTGEFVFDEPDMPVDLKFSFLVLGEGGSADNHAVHGKGYFEVELQGTAEEVWGNEGSNARQWTLNVYAGQESGVPVRHFFGGNRYVAHADVVGFDPAP